MLFFAFCLLPLCLAHMSMNFPRHRDIDANGNDYAQWKLNEPMVPARPTVCHGLPARAVPAENRFTANQIINVKLYNNVPHAGGHCSFWYSTDDVTFTKISDVKDCTLLFTSGSSVPVQLPETMAAECGTRCTFAWTWVPRVSAVCEIYSNCADIQVTGLSGQAPVNPHTQNFQNWVYPQPNPHTECQRVDDTTHWTTIMGDIITQSFPPTNALPTPLPTPRPPTGPIPSPLPTPRPPTATGSANGITFTNTGTVTKWWYATRLSNVANGFTIEYVEVESQGVWYYCEPDDSYTSYRVYGCQPGNDGFSLPLGVRLVSTEGEMISATGVVLNWDSNAVFNSGVNFVGLGHTSTTTTTSSTTLAPPTTATTSTSSTSTKAATSTTSSTSTSNPATTSTSTTSAGTTTTSTSSVSTTSGSKSNIIVVTRPSSTTWYYSCEVQKVPAGVVISDFKLKYNGNEVSCTNGGFTGILVFQCSPSQALVFPLDVEITGNGQTLNAAGAILNLDVGRAYDLGVQFSSGTVTPSTTSSTSSSTSSTTALPPTSSTLVSSTSSTSSTSSSTHASTSTSTSTSSTSSSAAPSTTTSSTSSSTSSSAAPATTTTTTTSTSSSNGQKEIIGYYAAWQWYDRNKLAKPVNMDFTKVTIVNFAFFQPDIFGNLFGTDSWADPNVLFGPYVYDETKCDSQSKIYQRKCHLKEANTLDCHCHKLDEGLIYLVQQAGAKIFPSIGGWSLSDNFPTLAASAQGRQNFAAQCVKLIEEYGFDGIDIDWEYPGYVDHSGTPADTVNFNLLLQEVRSALDKLGSQTGKYYQITAALPCGPSLIDNIDVSTVVSLLDQFNLTHNCGSPSNARLVENQVAVDSLEQKQQESSSCLVCVSVSLFTIIITGLFV